MSRQTTVARVEEIAQTVGQNAGIEIVEVELKGSGRNHLLRILIDKPSGVTHTDCETISRAAGELLDAEDILPGHYTLEVSSPGVERKLRGAADYTRFQGKKARIVLKEPLESKKYVEGILGGTDNSDLLVEVAEGQQLRIPLASIDRANLKFEW